MSSLITVIASYIFVEVLIYKGNKEVKLTRNIIYSIHQLKDIHTLCILDYKFHSDDKNILKECKKVETQIVTTLNNYYEQTPYLNFYKKYIE